MKERIYEEGKERRLDGVKRKEEQGGLSQVESGGGVKRG